MADSIKDSIDIAATAAEIFDVATDFASYPDWNESVKKVEVKATDEEGRATRVWFEVDAKLRVISYTLEYDYSRAPEGFSWRKVDGDVKELTGSYGFDEFGPETDVTYEMSVDPGFPVPKLLKRQAEKQIVRAALQDLKKRVESR